MMRRKRKTRSARTKRRTKERTPLARILSKESRAEEQWAAIISLTKPNQLLVTLTELIMGVNHFQPARSENSTTIKILLL